MTHTALLFGAAFLACTVEMVEALTIVLAVGTTREWRSTLYGVGAAGVILGALVAALGPALHSIPIDSLRIVVGTLLLLFGLQWLRKAILRASGALTATPTAATTITAAPAASAASGMRCCAAPKVSTRKTPLNATVNAYQSCACGPSAARSSATSRS